jgi:hypothetical protein
MAERGLHQILLHDPDRSTDRMADTMTAIIYRPNASARKDERWLDYISLSISRINTEFFEHSSRWHANRNVWWCALSFDPGDPRP